MYIAKIESYVAGIPCIVGVTDYRQVVADMRADNTWDYNGYTDCEWDVCDRRGRPAPWLAKKMSSNDESRIQGQIADHFSG